jgi:putative transposase
MHEMEGFLQKHAFKIGRDGMFRLLEAHGLLVRKRKRNGATTTLSRHRYKKYPNLIVDFTPTGANQLWVNDITYIHQARGFAYLSLITDGYSRKIVGFYLSKDLSVKGPLKALEMALHDNQQLSGLIHHSDRGSQYCCDGYVKLLEENRVKISMTEHSDPRENAIAERLNGILKQELLQERYTGFSEASQAITIACNTYNTLRPHSSIDYLKPAEAHTQTRVLERRWKNYYQINKKKQQEQQPKEKEEVVRRM